MDGNGTKPIVGDGGGGRGEVGGSDPGINVTEVEVVVVDLWEIEVGEVEGGEVGGGIGVEIEGQHYDVGGGGVCGCVARYSSWWWCSIFLSRAAFNLEGCATCNSKVFFVPYCRYCPPSLN